MGPPGAGACSVTHDHPRCEQPAFPGSPRARRCPQAIGDILGINVLTAEAAPDGCSVAGSCDRATRTITVVTAAVARMRFTVLHELAHLLGDDHGEFQDALYAVGPTKRAVEEDARPSRRRCCSPTVS